MNGSMMLIKMTLTGISLICQKRKHPKKSRFTTIFHDIVEHIILRKKFVDWKWRVILKQVQSFDSSFATCVVLKRRRPKRQRPRRPPMLNKVVNHYLKLPFIFKNFEPKMKIASFISFNYLLFKIFKS